jgi:DUF4097 and DUF4098 domain-containing protein YvlB
VKQSRKLVFFCLLLSPWMAAQESNISRQGSDWVQAISGSLSGARKLHVKLDGGTMHVEGGPQQQITYEVHNRAGGSSEEQARHQFERYKINAYVRGDTAWIVADWQSDHTQRFAGEFSIHVPHDIEQLTLETGGGGITVNEVGGAINAQSGGGPIRIHKVGGSVFAQTGGDSIEVGAIGGDANLQTGGGRIVVDSVKGRLAVSTGGGEILLVSSGQDAMLQAGGGNIRVNQCGGRLKASTGGGNIDVGNVNGAVEIQTGGGSIQVNSAKGPVHVETGAGRIALEGIPSARAETGSGSIEARFVAGADRTNSTLETAVGDITVYLPQNLNVSVRASIELANGHGIHSDFPDIRIDSEGGQWGPKTVSAEGNLNGGGPAIKASTSTGDIWFRRAN